MTRDLARPTRRIPRSSVCVSTREYERSHGRSPRGRGRWGFRAEEHIYGLKGPFPREFFVDMVEVGHTPTFSEAKRAAIAAAAGSGYCALEVLP